MSPTPHGSPPGLAGACALLLLSAAFASTAAPAQPLSASFERAFPLLTFEAPVALRADPSGTGWLFVAEQAGVVRTFPESDGATDAPVVLDIRDRVLGPDVDVESGLLGLALHPHFEENGHLFVYYVTDLLGAPSARLSRFEATGQPAVADPITEVVLLELPREDLKHNGGDVHFGPDGYLYVSIGDGLCCGDPLDHGQNRTNLFGTIIRIDVEAADGGLAYGIPQDNPFVGNAEGWREEIWAYGLRNPWRFSFDPATGDVWVGDVGEVGYEEINRIVSGGNYGWNVMEGPDCFEWPPGSGQGTECDQEGLILPEWYYGRDVGISVTGGHFYRGTRRPDLHGRYVFADWGSSRVFAAQTDADASGIVAVETLVDGDARFPSAFGEGMHGELYMLAYFSGEVFRLRAPPGQAPQMGHVHLGGANPVSTTTRFTIEILEVSRVALVVYDVLGRRVTTLVEEDWVSPSSFDVDFDTAGLASGTYFVALLTDGRVADAQLISVLRTR